MPGRRPEGKAVPGRKGLVQHRARTNRRPDQGPRAFAGMGAACAGSSPGRVQRAAMVGGAAFKVSMAKPAAAL